MKTENKAFYVTFTAMVDNEYKEMKVGKPFKSFDNAQQFAESASEAWNKVSNAFKYVNYTVSFH